MTGSKEEAVRLAVRILSEGAGALGVPRDDRERIVAERARRIGVINPDGTSNIATAAELVRICDLLSRVSPAPALPVNEPDLVFTAPPGVPIEPVVRLDLLVADVIRMSTISLHIGGPFWNEGGLAILDPVVIPALERGVTLDLWLHTSGDDYISVPRDWIARLRDHGQVTEHWYQSVGVSLMHAKFVIADVHRGYLGTANLTSLGMSAHVEIGTELTARQCQQLVSFLVLLDANDRFRE